MATKLFRTFGTKVKATAPVITKTKGEGKVHLYECLDLVKKQNVSVLLDQAAQKIEETKNPEKNNKPDDIKKPPPVKVFPFTEFNQVYIKSIDVPKTVKVSLLGAHCKAGRMAALLLKQNPLVSKVYLHGDRIVEDIATDLNCIDTSCRIEAYYGTATYGHSMRAADIVVLLDVDQKDDRVECKFQNSATRVAKFAEHCGVHCPRAVLVVCVEPICCMVPMVQKILEDTPWYHPSKLIGSVATLQTRINVTAADYLNLDPLSVHIPLLGGPDAKTVIPCLSIMVPDPYLSRKDTQLFYDHIKTEIARRVSDVEASTLNEGFAIAKMAITIAKGLVGHKNAISTAYSRSSHLHPLRYFVSTVKFAEGGIFDNYGIPKITRVELENLEEAILILHARHQNLKAKCYK